MEIRVKDTILRVEEDKFEIEKKEKIWKSSTSFSSNIVLNSGRSVLFETAKKIERVVYEDTLGKGILTRYRDLKGVNFAFDTCIWIHKKSEEVFFEWIPVNDHGFDIKEIQWPAPFMHTNGESYIPHKQGKKIVDSYFNDVNASFCSNEGSMSWIAQIDANQFGYICINETPWDSTYHLTKKEEGALLSINWIPSLGKMRNRRILRYVFKENTSIEALCELYRSYAIEAGMYAQKECVQIQENKAFKTWDVLNCFSKGTIHKIQNADGSIENNKLCTVKVLEYIKNDFDCLKEEELLEIKGIVETKLDECIHPAHKMTRKECLEYRKKILHYLNIKGKQIISKGYADWAVPYVDYVVFEEEEIEGMMTIDLFSLVYKDCFKKILHK